MVNKINKNIINGMIAQATEDENENLCIFLKRIIDSDIDYDKIILNLTYISDDIPENVAPRFTNLVEHKCSAEWIKTYIQFMQEHPSGNLLDYYDVLDKYIDVPFENIYMEALENTSNQIEFANYIRNYFDNKEPEREEDTDKEESLEPDDNKNLEIENSELTHQLHDMQHTIIQKDNAIEEYKEQLQKFREDAKVTQANYVELQKRYAKKAQDNDLMHFKLDRITSLSERLKKGNNKLIEEQKKITDRLEQLEGAASSHEGEIGELHQRIENLLAEKAELETNLSVEKSRLEELNAKIEELENQLAAIPSDIKAEDILYEEPGYKEALEEPFEFPVLDNLEDDIKVEESIETDSLIEPEIEDVEVIEEKKGYPIIDNCAEVKKTVNIFARLYYKYYEDRFVELNDANQDIVIKKKVVELNNLDIVKYVKKMLLDDNIAKVDIYKLVLKKASMEEFVALNNGV